MKNKFPYILLFLLFLLVFKTQSIAQVSINTSGSSPDGSAMLDISSGDKGLLIPRVSLISLTDQTTIASPATYLTIYNTNAAIGNGAGMYYWNDSSWTYLTSPSNGSGSNGQVLMSQGGGQAPQWNALPQTGGGGSICACFNNYQVFTSSGTFTTSATATLVKVAIWGGGGGGSGGGYNGESYSGAGGGGGGYAEGIFTVNPSSNYTVTVGNGGTGGAANNAGTGGGASSFDAFILATGGGAGTVNNNNNVALPGQGGFGVGGYLDISLGSGGISGSGGGNNNGGSPGGLNGVIGGGGGGGMGGGNGGSGENSPGNNAAPNSGAGGGGGGIYNGAGGNGANGQVIVYY